MSSRMLHRGQHLRVCRSEEYGAFGLAKREGIG
jgi:hypothetical protein